MTEPLGWAYLLYRNPLDAITELERAIELNPSEAHSHLILGFAKLYSGSAEEALTSHRTALRLSPNDPHYGWFNAGMALALLMLRRHEESAERAREALRYPNVQWLARAHFVSALAHCGRIEESKKALSDLLELQPNCTISLMEKRLPFTVDADRDHHLQGLRIAGMAED